LTKLPAREQYAAVELYRGTIARHSVIAYRDDHPGGNQLIWTGDSRWQSYVPIRRPRSICVQKNLPPGAAGVLINRAHTYTDLILPIDRYEKRLFDAIDGERTIAEIADHEPRRRLRARAFFERLWWYDQVVFDASRVGTHRLRSARASAETAHE
jgi:hypothetical protein